MLAKAQVMTRRVQRRLVVVDRGKANLLGERKCGRAVQIRKVRTAWSDSTEHEVSRSIICCDEYWSLT